MYTYVYLKMKKPSTASFRFGLDYCSEQSNEKKTILGSSKGKVMSEKTKKIKKHQY